MNEHLILSFVFAIGYAAIAFEFYIRINKAASAIITGVVCWTIIILNSCNVEITNSLLDVHLSQISGILFFLLGAMTIVELIDMHNGFEVITKYIEASGGKKLLWLIGFITFFLSSILDNLTTTIVMISLLRKIIKDQKLRLIFVSVVVIAANAGGAWTPIGDVTTTMLWMGNQVHTIPIMTRLFFPSIVCLLIPLAYFNFKIKSIPNAFQSVSAQNQNSENSNPRAKKVLIAGISALLFVPVFKGLTGLPPYIAILFGLAVLWIYIEYLNGKNKSRVKHTVSDALQRIDTPTVLFFLGILLSVAALKHSGILSAISYYASGKDSRLFVSVIGLISAVVDNVPLVNAVQGMYPMDPPHGSTDLLIQTFKPIYPSDNSFWLLLAYCAGTGGSILIIGSAAGVAAMGKEKIDFFWYLKNISFIALIAYITGILVYLFQSWLIMKI